MILFASLLKPVNDIRMYEKLAKSILNNVFLWKKNEKLIKKNICILGFKPKNKVENTENIRFYPVFDFHRLSPKRFFAQFIFFWFLCKLRPKILIVCTFELLFFAVIYKILFGTKLIYDVQENYHANIFYTQVFPAWVRMPLGYAVKFWEKFWINWVDEFWLAEKCYLEELHLEKRNCIFLENKVVFSQIKPFFENIQNTNHFNKNLEIKFLISGTLGEDYGTLQAIDWFKNYQKNNPNAQLDIVGFCAKKSDFEKIQNNILNCENIILTGGNSLVESNIILEKASFTDFWIMPYLQNENIKNRIPTKFYEAIAFKKKIILPKNTSQNVAWNTFLKENYYLENVVFVDFSENNIDFHLQKNILQKAENLETIFWENEIKNLEKSKVFC